MAVTLRTWLATSYSAGDSVIEVDDMAGWQQGDVIAIRSGHTGGHRAVSRRQIRSINATFIVLDGGLQSDHPVTVERWGTIVDKQWTAHTAKVVNLTAKIRARQPWTATKPKRPSRSPALQSSWSASL